LKALKLDCLLKRYLKTQTCINNMENKEFSIKKHYLALKNRRFYRGSFIMADLC
jgi:hypothetical protein